MLRTEKLSISPTDPEVSKVLLVKMLLELETLKPPCISVKSPPPPELLSSPPRCLVSWDSLMTPSPSMDSQLSWIKLPLKINPSLSIFTPTQKLHTWLSQEWTLKVTPSFKPIRLLRRNTGHSSSTP